MAAVRRKAVTGGRSPGAKTPPDMFDLDAFITAARDKQVEKAFLKNEIGDYDKAVTDLENSIREKNRERYTDADKHLNTMLTKKNRNAKVNTLLVELKKLSAVIKSTKGRGDWFQNIKFREDSRMPPDIPRDDKSVPKVQQTDMMEKLLTIEKILDDTPADGKGAKQKKPDSKRTTDEVLVAIERLCTNVVNDRDIYRAKAGTTDVKDAIAKRHLKVAQEWMTKFEMQMKEGTVEEFTYALQQSNELDAIREILNRLISGTRQQEKERKAVDDYNTKQAKKLLSRLIIQKSKPGNDKNSKSTAEKNIEQLLEISISELDKQIDWLRNQESRLNSISEDLGIANQRLVADKKKTNKAREQKKSNREAELEQGQQIETLTAILESGLKDLEVEFASNQKFVKQVDDEIQSFESDLEDWTKPGNIKDLDNNFDKCALKDLRSARLKIQKYKKDTVDKKSIPSKQDDMKKLTKLCNDYGIPESERKDEKYVDMIKELGTRLQSDKVAQEEMKKLKEAIKKLCNDNDVAGSKDDNSVDMLNQLQNRLKTNQKLLKTLENELNGLQEENKNTQAGSKTSETITEIDTLIAMAQNAKTTKQKYEEQQQRSFKELKDLESALLKLEKDVSEISDEHKYSPVNSTQATPVLLKTVDNIQKEFVKLKETNSMLERSLQEIDAKMQQFSDEIDPSLNTAINRLTNTPMSTPSRLPELPSRLRPIIVKVVFIESISEQCLTSLCNAYNIILGKPFQLPAKPNKGGGNHSENNIDSCIQILVDDATSAGITRDNVSKLRTQVKEIDAYKREVLQLQREVSHWKSEAKSEAKEKMEYMTRLSKVASAKLTNNNPNIADLSDPNRQTKLAEEYGQLYDNEWTNAYEEVEESEENRINYLLNILTTVYNKCADLRTQQLTGMKMALIQPANFFCLLNHEHAESFSGETGMETNQKSDTKQKDKKKVVKSPKSPQSKPASGATKQDSDDHSLGAIQSQAVTELGKQTYKQALLDITKYFQRSQTDWFNRRHVAMYTTKCIEMCWLMNIHSPPVCLDATAKKGDTFDKTKYREYTARGKKVKFVVWPIILLHKDGPTLGKGVAQGMG